MRDFSVDHRWLSLNTATVRKQGDLAAIIEACARHGIRAIDPCFAARDANAQAQKSFAFVFDLNCGVATQVQFFRGG